MRVFVTGWTGLLGSLLVPLLRARQHEVSGMDVHDGDIADRRVVREHLQAAQPHVVIHLAAYTAVDACESDPDTAFRVNAEGSRVVAVEAENLEAQVIAMSSDYVFDGASNVPYHEQDTPAPLSVYGRSKLAGEEAVRGASTRWTVVRSAWLYAHTGPNFVDTILGLLDTRDRLSVVDDQTGSPTYAVDLAQALVAISERKLTGTLHVVNGGEATWCALAREAARLRGLDPARIQPASTESIGRPAPRPRYSVLATSQTTRALGAPLRDWQLALREHLSR